MLIPRETMFGSLIYRLTEADGGSYTPEPVNFGMLPVQRGDDSISREERRELQVQKSEAVLAKLLAEQMSQIRS